MYLTRNRHPLFGQTAIRRTGALASHAYLLHFYLQASVHIYIFTDSYLHMYVLRRVYVMLAIVNIVNEFYDS